MGFDETRIYTSLTADVVKPGSRGYVADNLTELKKKVENNKVMSAIAAIGSEDDMCRFISDSELRYNLFYLVEEPEEKKFRPYRNADEFISDYRKRFCPDYLGIPAIWVKNKAGLLKQVAMIHTDEIRLAETHYTTNFDTLLDSYSYSDGTQCGIEEE